MQRPSCSLEHLFMEPRRVGSASTLDHQAMRKPEPHEEATWHTLQETDPAEPGFQVILAHELDM